MNKPTKAELGGMTVNERIFAMGLMDEWDKAAHARERETMMKILSQCAMSREQCAETIDALLKNPGMYGF